MAPVPRQSGSDRVRALEMALGEAVERADREAADQFLHGGPDADGWADCARRWSKVLESDRKENLDD
jgi:hypothetical protein